jgi:hypothetical protein
VLWRLAPCEQLWAHNVWTFVVRCRARFATGVMPSPGDPVGRLFRERMPNAETDLAHMLACARDAIHEWLHYDDRGFCEWLLNATPGWGANPALMARYATGHDELYAALGDLRRRCAYDAAVVASTYARPYEAPCPRYRPRDQAEANWLEAEPEAALLLSNLLVLVERAKFALTLRRQAWPGLRGAPPDAIPALLADARAVWPLAKEVHPSLWARFGAAELPVAIRRCETLYFPP